MPDNSDHPPIEILLSRIEDMQKVVDTLEATVKGRYDYYRSALAIVTAARRLRRCKCDEDGWERFDKALALHDRARNTNADEAPSST